MSVESPLYLVDASAWQGALNWKGVEAEGYVGGIAKATEGTYFRDGQFVRNILGMKATEKVTPGAYHFLTHENIKDQLDLFLSQSIESDGRFIAVDVETVGWAGGDPTATDVWNFVIGLRERLGNQHPILIYSGWWYWSGHLGNPDITPLIRDHNCYLWLSHYVSVGRSEAAVAAGFEDTVHALPDAPPAPRSSWYWQEVLGYKSKQDLIEDENADPALLEVYAKEQEETASTAAAMYGSQIYQHVPRSWWREEAFGGHPPTLLQFTDSAWIQNQHMDCNAYAGTQAELRALASDGGRRETQKDVFKAHFIDRATKKVAEFTDEATARRVARQTRQRVKLPSDKSVGVRRVGKGSRGPGIIITAPTPDYKLWTPKDQIIVKHIHETHNVAVTTYHGHGTTGIEDGWDAWIAPEGKWGNTDQIKLGEEIEQDVIEHWFEWEMLYWIFRDIYIDTHRRLVYSENFDLRGNPHANPNRNTLLHGDHGHGSTIDG